MLTMSCGLILSVTVDEGISLGGERLVPPLRTGEKLVQNAVSPLLLLTNHANEG